MKPRIVVSVINNIAYDQRVAKTCQTLWNDGYDILLIGTKLHGAPEIKREYKTYRFPLWFSKSFLLYAEFNLRLFFQLLFKSKKTDILWANDLDSLLPNYLISKIKGQKLIYDSHELFSELPSIQGKFSQKVWRKLEKWLIHKSQKTITVSESIAEWYEEQYFITKPEIIMNLPYAKDTIWTDKSENYLLYQGVLSYGRGLFSMIESLVYLPENITLKIAGQGPIKSELEEKINTLGLQNRVEFLGNLKPEDLYPVTTKALLGLSLEEDLGLSYRYSLPNKLFDYIQAKIPAVTTYLPEIQHIVRKYRVGEVIANHDAEEVAKQIKLVIENGKLHYRTSLENASKELIWEHQEHKLLDIVSSVLESSNEIA